MTSAFFFSLVDRACALCRPQVPWRLVWMQTACSFRSHPRGPHGYTTGPSLPRFLRYLHRSCSLFSSRPPEDTCPPAAARLYDMCHLGSTHVHDIRCFPLAATTSMVYLGGTAEDAPRPAHQCDACGKTDFKGRKVRSWRCGAWRRHHLIAVELIITVYVFRRSHIALGAIAICAGTRTRSLW